MSIADNHNLILQNEREGIYEGKVVSVDVGESNTKLVIDTGDKGQILLSYYGEESFGQELLGTAIKFETTLSIPKGKTNPRCFDYRLYLKSMGIDYVGNTTKIVRLKDADNQYDRFCRFLMAKKEGFLESIKNTDTRNFVEGILFGNTDRLDEDVYDQFKINGTAHILAVSGLHIGIMYELIQRLLGKKQSLLKAIITVSIMVSLGIVMEWTPSVSRAIGLILIKMYAQYFDKRYDSLTAISLIAIIMIAVNPYVVFSPQFENLGNTEYSKNKNTYFNSVYVAGEGEGSDRIILEVNDELKKGLFLREKWVDAKTISSTTEDGSLLPTEYLQLLADRGREELKITQEVTSFSGEILNLNSYRYGIDYFLGDKVQIETEYEMTGKAQITEITEVEDDAGYKIYPTLSEWGD